MTMLQSRAPNRELALPSKRCLDSPTDDKTQSHRQRLRTGEQVAVRTSSPGGPSCSAQDGGPSCSAQDGGLSCSAQEDIAQLVADQEVSVAYSRYAARLCVRVGNVKGL
jgi:hypothetical protein